MARARTGVFAPDGQKKEKANLISQTGLYLCRQRPTLPHTFACSTIGPAGLNFRVRDGNGWIPRGMITDKSEQLLAISSWLLAWACWLRSWCSTHQHDWLQTFKEREVRYLTAE